MLGEISSIIGEGERLIGYRIQVSLAKCSLAENSFMGYLAILVCLAWCAESGTISSRLLEPGLCLQMNIVVCMNYRPKTDAVK